MATTVIYAVDLSELERWVGARDESMLIAARATLRDVEEEEAWEPEELALLDRLLLRVVNEGKLYDGLPSDERYYLTQLLIDLFDEFVDSEAVTDEIPHERLVATLDGVHGREPDLELLVRAFSQGRTLGGDAPHWNRDEDLDEVLPFFGYLRHAELPALVPALERALRSSSGPAPRGRGPRSARSSHDVRPLLDAIRLAIESERDLLSFTG